MNRFPRMRRQNRLGEYRYVTQGSKFRSRGRFRNAASVRYPFMKTAIDVIVNGLTESQAYLHRFIDDLKPAEFLHRPSPKANCAAWILGHLTLTDRRGLTALKVSELAKLPDGFEKRFGRDEAAAMALEFGDLTILPRIFDENRKQLIDAVKRTPLEQLNAPLPFEHPRFKTPGEMVSFYCLHTAMHAGQITYIRRSLGRPPIV